MYSYLYLLDKMFLAHMFWSENSTCIRFLYLVWFCPNTKACD